MREVEFQWLTRSMTIASAAVSYTHLDVYKRQESTMVDVTKVECAPGDIVSFDTVPSSVDGSVRRSYV